MTPEQERRIALAAATYQAGPAASLAFVLVVLAICAIVVVVGGAAIEISAITDGRPLW